LKYRSEIDGLRALAVIPVIFFHAGYSWFSGGYVGVDVFFVISGYLITSLLIEDINNDRFSLIDFYERRARRILPALFLVMLACLPFAWLTLLPDQMESFSKSLIAVSWFVSNMLFWKESGYFESASDEKPLLHTWSLSVEEQFYIFFPFILLIVFKYRRKNSAVWIFMIALGSYFLSHFMARVDTSANFYLFLTRAWELLVGSSIALMLKKYGLKESNIFSILGIFALIFSITVYDETLLFPSLYTLLPVLGTALILCTSGQSTLVGRILKFKGFVYIGLLSYSAYLWHQPIFAFLRVVSLDEVSHAVMPFAISITFVLAYISWKYIEQPFRGKDKIFERKGVFVSSGIGILLFSLIGIVGDRTNGFMMRLNEEQQKIVSYEKYDAESQFRQGICFLDKRESSKDFDVECVIDNKNGYFVWGDSHAAALASGMIANGLIVSQRTASGCPPILNKVIEYPSRPYCEEINKSNFELIKNSNQPVVLHANWSLYKGDVVEEFSETIQLLRKGGVKNIIVVGSVPKFEPELPKILLNSNLLLNSEHSIEWSDKTISDIDRKLEAQMSILGVKYKSPLDVLCKDGESCKVVVDENGEYFPIAWDYGHLTLEGAKYLSSYLFENK
jgi:peptidoglycan/LPS O-acetylase OafA/YrhL